MEKIIVSFSSRNNGNCSKITRYIDNMFGNSRKFLFSDFSVQPCGNCDYECFQKSDACPHIQDMEYKLLEAICGSKQAIFVVPNYCDHPCANFYIFNERSLCYFQGHPERLEQYLSVPKKFAVVSGSESASFPRAFEQHTNGAPEILYLSAKKFGKRSIDGDLLTAEQAVQALEQFLA